MVSYMEKIRINILLGGPEKDENVGIMVSIRLSIRAFTKRLLFVAMEFGVVRGRRPVDRKEVVKE